MNAAEPEAAIVVGVFADEAALAKAAAELEARGIAQDFLGALLPAEIGQSARLSVRAPRGRQIEIEEVFQHAGAVAVGTAERLQQEFGPPPHPGAWEDHDLKLPAGREYPETRWPPALSLYRLRMRTLDPRERLGHFDEVELGYTPEEAFVEASRCLLCPRPRCVEGCPAHNDIPGFIRAICEGDFGAGVEVLRRTTNFPGICGRVCNKAAQCEGACVLNREGGEPIAIGSLERFLADWESEQGRRLAQAQTKKQATGKKVAVVGSGPSGLACAGDLALRGDEVTVYEALPVLGGALAWGIPTFRLPQRILDSEIGFLRALGVEFVVNTKIGEHLTLDDLFAQGVQAVFLGAGANISTKTGLPGEDLLGVYTATEFLTRSKLSRLFPELYRPPQVGRRLAIIGAGNTALDVAQTALRLGAASGPQLGVEEPQTAMDVLGTAIRLGVEEVTVVYRRSEAEMPARPEEVESAEEEGVKFRFLTAPVRFIGDERGRLVAMECCEMALGAPDERGRRRPVPKPGTELVMPVDTVVLALGYRADTTLLQGAQGLLADRAGLLIVDRATGRTGITGVWAGGDVVLGPDTVVRAMAAGKRAAEDIHRHLVA